MHVIFSDMFMLHAIIHQCSCLLEGPHDMPQILYCQRRRTSEGHRQSRTLEKWLYLGNGAR